MLEKYIGFEASMYAVFFCLGVAATSLINVIVIVIQANIVRRNNNENTE